MSVEELLRTKLLAVVGLHPNQLSSVLPEAVGAVEHVLTLNGSTNPVLPTLLNDQLLKKELEVAKLSQVENEYIDFLEDEWLQMGLAKKAVLTKILLSVFPEIDILENVLVLSNLKALYERQDRPDEFS